MNSSDNFDSNHQSQVNDLQLFTPAEILALTLQNL